jgi:hypothetical protein
MVLAPNVASVMFIITQCVHQGLDIAWRYFFVYLFVLFSYLYYGTFACHDVWIIHGRKTASLMFFFLDLNHISPWLIFLVAVTHIREPRKADITL